MIDRRAFLRASLALACAPMIVRAGSLMRLPVKQLLSVGDGGSLNSMSHPTWTIEGIDQFGRVVAVTMPWNDQDEWDHKSISMRSVTNIVIDA